MKLFWKQKKLIIIPVETLMKIKIIKSIFGIEEENSEKKLLNGVQLFKNE